MQKSSFVWTVTNFWDTQSLDRPRILCLGPEEKEAPETPDARNRQRTLGSSHIHATARPQSHIPRDCGSQLLLCLTSGDRKTRRAGTGDGDGRGGTQK